jgi:hypothetical protein
MISAPGPYFVKHLIGPEPIRVEHFTVLTKAYYTILKNLPRVYTQAYFSQGEELQHKGVNLMEQFWLKFTHTFWKARPFY